MSTASNPQAWSTTAASNTNNDADIGIVADTSFPRQVHNWYLSDMAAFSRYLRDAGGALRPVATVPNVWTVDTHQKLDAAHIAAGLRLAVVSPETNTSGTVTFSPDGLTARNIKAADGSSPGIGQIRAGGILQLIYNVASTEWRAMNVITGSNPGSSTASFYAHKNGLYQATTTASTKITFPVQSWDIGSAYNTSTSLWTPPAGTVRIAARLMLHDVYIFETVQIYLYKNGSLYKKAINTVLSDDDTTEDISSASIKIIDTCSGTDTYGIYLQMNDLDETGYNIVLGDKKKTWFYGTMV